MSLVSPLETKKQKQKTKKQKKKNKTKKKTQKLRTSLRASENYQREKEWGNVCESCPPLVFL